MVLAPRHVISAAASAFVVGHLHPAFATVLCAWATKLATSEFKKGVGRKA